MLAKEIQPMVLRARFFDELWKVSRRVRTLFDARVRAKGLTLARARTLMLLAKKHGMTQTELADGLEIEGPTLVRLLDGLEKQELIERRPVVGDRRAKQIALSVAGQKEAVLVGEIVQDVRNDVLKDVSEDDLKAALRVFHAMARNIEAAS
jgi:MarR family transcriptional regulator, transcriptional regulator for hemolysin